ncbi:MAG TPA: hypothetical protein VJX48_09780 [Xanthobacteraceae bacterium]|nr:hypothetical protein [Xanthobacteraceae bacterium]
MRKNGDNIQPYASVLRRIIILVAVITAVPVVMWTITAFMRAYVAQPTVPTARPIAATTSITAPAGAVAPATPDADPSRPIPAIVEARATTTDARSSDVNAKSDRLRDSASNASASNASASNAPSGDPNVAAAAVAEQTPSTAPMAAQPAADKLAVQSAPEPAAPASDAGPHTAPTLAAQPQPAPAAADAAAEPLPSSEPIAGPIPLPRHRPNVFAMAETDVPLPRARPATAPEPTSDTMSDAPSSGYDPAMAHH